MNKEMAEGDEWDDDDDDDQTDDDDGDDDDSKNLKAVERAVILDEEVLLFTYREVVAKLECSVFNIFYDREVSVIFHRCMVTR